MDSGESSVWSFGGNKKNKTKTTTSGFDFGDFSTLDELQEDHSKLGTNADDSTNAGADGDWAPSFLPLGKKDKKKKKGTLEEISNEHEAAIIEIPLTDTVTAPAESWGAWGTAASKKEKKKPKKGDVEHVGDDSSHVPPPPPDPPVEAAGEDDYGFAAKREKKKGKKGAWEESTQAEESVAAVVVVPEPEPAADDAWGAFSTKKDKRKGKKGEKPVVEEPKAQEPAVVVVAESGPAANDTWGAFPTKDKKKGKKDSIDELLDEDELAVDEEPEVAPVVVEGWGAFSTKKDKKKGRKGATTEEPKFEEAAVIVVSEPDHPADEGWGGFSTKKDKKKGKKGEVVESNTTDDLLVAEPQAETTWDTWGTASKKDKDKDKNKKKGTIAEVKDDSIIVAEPSAAVEAIPTTAGDDWMNFDTGKKKEKKGKKGGATEPKVEEALPPPPPPPPPPTVPDFPVPSKNDIWGTSKKDVKDKKVKKGKVAETEPESEVVIVPESVAEKQADPIEEDLGGWGLSGKDKKKKEKEKVGKKGTVEVLEGSKSKDLMADSVPDITPTIEEDTWGMFGGSKKDKKKGGKFEAPPPAPTPPAQGLTPEPDPILDDVDDWGSFAPVQPKGKKDTKKGGLTRTTSTAKATDTKDVTGGKKGSTDKNVDLLSALDDPITDDAQDASKKYSPKDEAPAKAVKGFWGGLGSMNASKSKSSKDKDKEKEEEKAKKDAELDLDLDLYSDMDEIVEIVEEPAPAKKGSKAKADGKLTKVNIKEGDKGTKVDDKKKKSDGAKLIDIVEEASDTMTKTSAGKIAEKKDETKDEPKKDDAWSFWGSTKKTAGNSGKKADEPKKEITKPDATNQKASLDKPDKGRGAIWNEPEHDGTWADEAAHPVIKSTSTKATTMKAAVTNNNSNYTGVKASSVAEQIKALEKEKLKKAEAKATPPAPVPVTAPVPVPQGEPEPLPKKESPAVKKANALLSSSAKSKSAATGKTLFSKKKDSSPPPKESNKNSKDSVPGSFPSEGAEDDIIDVIDLPPAEKRTNKKNAKSKKEPVMDDFIVEAPAPPPLASGPPTPPPEPMPSKPAKKERARVVRDEGASSWGFWGAAPKKEVKAQRRSKDDADVVSPAAKEKATAPGLGRSKSTRTAKDKDKEAEKSSRSSGSDKVKTPETRPANKSRGMSFSQMIMGGPPPSRTKTVRRPSTAVPKSSSRRQSMDVGALGMPSPPPDDIPEMNSKAAKLMGMGSGKLGRKESTRGKQKASGTNLKSSVGGNGRNANRVDIVIPDPYPIDDDDMVMVNALEDPIINAPLPSKETFKDARKDRPLKSRSKREVGSISNVPMMSQPAVLSADKMKLQQSKHMPDFADDIVMVEAGPSNDGPEVVTGPEDLAFVEKAREPAPLKRSMTSAKKQDGLMGLFGSFRKNRRASETFDPPKGKTIYEDERSNVRRKRTGAGGDDDAKRMRRDERRDRHSHKNNTDVEGFMTDAAPNGGASTEAEETEARREERRAKRLSKDQIAKEARAAEVRESEERKARRLLSDKAQTEARKAKIREARDQKAREEEDREARRQEDKRARRGAREERYAQEDVTPRDMEKEPSSRPRKSDRRRSHMDKSLPTRTPDEEAEHRIRREERRARHDKPSTSRRKSAPAPVEDYFDPRNGDRGAPPHTADPYLQHGGNDHTSSWVNSQIIEPPPPPPIEPTVLDPPPDVGADNAAAAAGVDDADDDLRRSRRKSSRRHSKYVDAGADEVDEKGRRRSSRRERELKSSEESEGDRYARRKSEYVYGGGGGGGGGGVKTFDGRNVVSSAGNASTPGKRMSLFKKFTNL